MTRPWVVRSGPWSEGDVAGRIARSRGLDPALEQRHDPFLMAGMADAVGRLRRAIDQRERILVFGDYDADGVNTG
jgi:single-stranded-DNA-specific exonuclease